MLDYIILGAVANWILLSAAAGAWAERLGRDYFSYMAIGFVFSPLTAIVWLIAIGPKWKLCTNCAERHRPKAKICPHCGTAISGAVS